MTQDGTPNAQPLTFMLNGVPVVVPAHPGARLLDVLRDAGLVQSVRDGCGEGACGSCTVLLDGAPVVSCLVLAQSVEGQRVITLEGIAGNASEEGHPLCRALTSAGVDGCGACFPGVVMAALGLLQAVDNPTAPEVRRALSGVHCRCHALDRAVVAIQGAAHEVRRRNAEPTENLPAALVAEAVARGGQR